MAFRSRTCTSALSLQRSITSTSSRAAATVNPFIRLGLRSRTMATPANRKFEWLVVVPDFPGTLAKRLEVRPAHFAGLKEKIDSGTFVMGGAVLEDVPVDDEVSSLKFSGSTVVMVASSKEEILETLRADPYTKNGVWDVDNAQMWPFKCAFRIPVPGQSV
ncbi:hypothetical protein B0T16DRAFT_407134 [Cercophora newfieldiana]|uniref:YCII-related domain-containing protein n=1 Tax=Cercophora newfieldiana TaxID=92897 RepID=A0AA39YHY6_9PEZI|nr:hypothetical protein B0T16DRAFT_407134 [Cercophora newfieldiana]